MRPSNNFVLCSSLHFPSLFHYFLFKHRVKVFVHLSSPHPLPNVYIEMNIFIFRILILKLFRAHRSKEEHIIYIKLKWTPQGMKLNVNIKWKMASGRDCRAESHLSFFFLLKIAGAVLSILFFHWWFLIVEWNFVLRNFQLRSNFFGHSNKLVFWP